MAVRSGDEKTQGGGQRVCTQDIISDLFSLASGL